MIKINKILSHFNIRLEKISHNPKLMDLLSIIMKNKKIDLVYDIGANIGQFSKNLREHGYKGNILSFEPVKKIHSKLVENSKNDSKWEVFERCALGNQDGEIDITISQYDLTSSILEMTQKLLDAKKNSNYIGKEKTNIFKLDTIIKKVNLEKKRAMLKIDTQGYEWQVLQGVKNNLTKFDLIFIEVSFVKLYQDEKLWNDIINHVASYGFELWSFERGFIDPNTKQILQADVVFYKK